MLKKFLLSLSLMIFFLSFFTGSAFAQEKKPIYLFWSKTCPHCAREKVFLNNLVEKYPQIEVKDFEISSSQENRDLFRKVGEKFGSQGYVPFTVVGKYHFVGFLDDQTTGKKIEEAVQCYLAEGCQDVVKDLISSSAPPADQAKNIPDTLSLPLVGEIKIKSLSLPALTFVIGLLDGFNPCAMWTLLFLISLLLGMRNRKKMWALGMAFIAASGLLYFLFMTAWLNLFMFLGLVVWIRIAVGAVALAAGYFSLADFWRNRKGGCKTEEDEKRQKVFEKIKKITQNKKFILALGGMILLAFTVNLIEMVCSAGLPAVYTQILSLAQLPRWQYYFYLLFYILIYMLDDLVVFVIAMVTLRAVGVQSKYARWSRLIGGILMVIIALLLFFRPEWLTFS